MMSCSVIPPQPCTASLSSVRAPNEVMTIGTLYLAQLIMSASKRSLERWTIWLTANAADDPRLALGDDQVGVGHDEQGRADHRQAKAVENRGQAHAASLI